MNTVPQKTRKRIYSHAEFLVRTCGVDNADVDDIATALMDIFGISRDRARNATARGVRRERARLQGVRP